MGTRADQYPEVGVQEVIRLVSEQGAIFRMTVDNISNEVGSVKNVLS